jgi:hypothetical protein
MKIRFIKYMCLYFLPLIMSSEKTLLQKLIKRDNIFYLFSAIASYGIIHKINKTDINYLPKTALLLAPAAGLTLISLLKRISYSNSNKDLLFELLFALITYITNLIVKSKNEDILIKNTLNILCLTLLFPRLIKFITWLLLRKKREKEEKKQELKEIKEKKEENKREQEDKLIINTLRGKQVAFRSLRKDSLNYNDYNFLLDKHFDLYDEAYYCLYYYIDSNTKSFRLAKYTSQQLATQKELTTKESRIHQRNCFIKEFSTYFNEDNTKVAFWCDHTQRIIDTFIEAIEFAQIKYFYFSLITKEIPYRDNIFINNLIFTWSESIIAAERNFEEVCSNPHIKKRYNPIFFNNQKKYIIHLKKNPDKTLPRITSYIASYKENWKRNIPSENDTYKLYTFYNELYIHDYAPKNDHHTDDIATKIISLAQLNRTIYYRIYKISSKRCY